MAYVLAVTWTAKQGHEAEVHEFLRILGEASRQEPGVITYTTHVDPDNPREFFIYEKYHDLSGLEAHQEGVRARKGDPAARVPGAPDLRRLLELLLAEKGLVANDGDAIHDPVCGAVVVRGIMLGTAIVPESDIPFLPGMTNLEIRQLRVMVQQVQQVVAFRFRKLVDARGVVLVDKQRGAPGFAPRCANANS